jgi:Protein of unknown function DUF262
MDDLQAQITARRREISTDAYSMSIGELTNLYRERELDVHPEFQRVYRWTDEQKSNLVESILLGIPIPSIFVAQNDDGTWDVVDGVQRISTVLQLQGLLKDDEGNPVPPLNLKATRYLPQLEGRYWEHEAAESSLTHAQRLDIRRAKVDLKIIKRESTPGAKYDLFQRLNGYGTMLTAQELRSCMLVSTSRELYSWLLRLRDFEPFHDTISLYDRLIEEQYDLELALRFLLLKDLPVTDIKKVASLGEFLTERSVGLPDSGMDPDVEERRFKRTFKLLAEAVSDNAFRKFDPTNDRFQGTFSNTAFEVFALGLGHHIDYYDARPDEANVSDRIFDFWRSGAVGTGFATGKSPNARLSKTLPWGRGLFKPSS